MTLRGSKTRLKRWIKPLLKRSVPSFKSEDSIRLVPLFTRSCLAINLKSERHSARNAREKYVGQGKEVLPLVRLLEARVADVPNGKFDLPAVRLPREAPAQLLGKIQVRTVNIIRFIFVSRASAEK